MSKEPDFDIDKYEIGELLDIFNIAEPVQKEAIMKIAGEFIDKYKQLQQSQYVEFFSQAMNKLISNYHQVEGILGKVNYILDDAIETSENIKQTIEDIQENAGNMYENAEDLYDEVQDRAEKLIDHAEDIYEQGANAYNDVKKITNEFLNSNADDAGSNVLGNMYYNGQTGHEKAGNIIMPPRGNYISVPDDAGVNHHAPQLQQRLMMPNAFGKIPYAQGYKNPTLQNAYISWVNVDSQYREIKPTGIESANCSKFAEPSNNIYQNDSSTDFLFTLQSPITNVLAMTVGSIEIPLSGYYAFSDRYGNTTFEIQINKNDDTSCHLVRIPEGNYNAAALKQVIDAQLENICEDPIHLYINPWNQKAVFISNCLLKFIWFEKSRCGCCKDCCDDSNRKEYICSDKNTGKKINSTLGWLLGFRQANTNFNLISDSDIDLTFLPTDVPKPDSSDYVMVGNSVWNELGTKYFILELDDFNRNRNTGNMGTMTMPSSTEKFKLPSYAKELSQVYPIWNDKTPPQPPSPSSPWPHKYPTAPLINNGNKNRPLEYTTNGDIKQCVSGYYENFTRPRRKGIQAERFGIKGHDTLTKAQKYTALELSNARTNNATSQYFAPQASDILFRFPVERFLNHPQVPLIVRNTAGMANGRKYFGPVTIEKLRVRLLDDKGYPVDLHSADISFSLIMERLYQY